MLSSTSWNEMFRFQQLWMDLRRQRITDSTMLHPALAHCCHRVGVKSGNPSWDLTVRPSNAGFLRHHQQYHTLVSSLLAKDDRQARPAEGKIRAPMKTTSGLRKPSTTSTFHGSQSMIHSALQVHILMPGLENSCAMAERRRDFALPALAFCSSDPHNPLAIFLKCRRVRACMSVAFCALFLSRFGRCKRSDQNWKIRSRDFQ